MSIGAALWTGVAGLNSFSTAMSVVSDDVANASTTGYKSNSVQFGDMVNTYLALQSNGIQGEGSGSDVLGISTDFAQGNLQGTTNWSDLAVSGKGFFIVKQPDASGSTSNSANYYTRDGGFHLDSGGYLINAQGYRVQGVDANGQAADIQIQNPQNYASFSVSNDGTITGVDTTNGNTPTNLGTIELADFGYEGGLVRQGGNLYMGGPDINTNNTFYKSQNPTIFGKISEDNLEGSNVDMAKEMVNMIIYQASYNANSKTITTASNMLDTTINMVR